MSAAAEERTVRLLDEDADLAERIAPERRAAARTELLARMVTLAAGARVEQSAPLRDRDAHGLLLLEGLVGRALQLGDTTAVQLLGPGDLMEVPGDTFSAGMMPVSISWTVLEPTTVALLDEALMQRAQRWPELLTALLDRASVQSLRLGTYCAISSMARVEDRIETLLWFLAERWGRIGSHGVVLPLRLTHEALGQMLGAKRPTVSLALKQLAADNLVERRADGAWLLLRQWEELPTALAGLDSRTRLVTPAPDDERPLAASPAADPALAALHSSYGNVGQLEARIERMGAVHARMRSRVRSSLDAASRTRERSVALRSRVRSESAARAVPPSLPRPQPPAASNGGRSASAAPGAG